MKIETKYNVGDTVWYRKCTDKLIKKKIIGIAIHSRLLHGDEIFDLWYTLADGSIHREKELARAIEEQI